MKRYKKKSLLVLVILVFLLQISIAYAQAPYEITVDPISASIAKDEVITYNIDITADPGFVDLIDITLEVSVLGATEYFNLGTAFGPYPMTFVQTLDVPEEVPAGVTINGKILATSGSYIVEEDVEIHIKGGNIITNILNAIIQTFRGIVRTISNLF
ncbi:hypothetical protein ACFL0D_08570 [Thermoproteota archaeon]